jgi:integrin-linked kinase
MFLARGSRVNAVNMGEDTPLHLAAAHGHVDVVMLLIKAKSDINAQNEHGNSQLQGFSLTFYLKISY